MDKINKIKAELKTAREQAEDEFLSECKRLGVSPDRGGFVSTPKLTELNFLIIDLEFQLHFMKRETEEEIDLYSHERTASHGKQFYLDLRKSRW